MTVTQNIHGIEVTGVEVDTQTRCSHWSGELDIIAIRFKCCERWFPCFDCHTVMVDHQPTVWSQNERETKAVLCGACGHDLTINEYLNCDSTCPRCARLFNPGCAKHHQLYFD